MSSSFVTVITYNVLSSDLTTQEDYPSYSPDVLHEDLRYKRLLGRLDAEIRDNDSPIFCLQEVSETWDCGLYAFFEERDYTFLSRLYGWHGNGYMGVAIAFPKKKYDMIRHCHRGIGKTLGAPPPKPKPVPFWKRALGYLPILGRTVFDKAAYERDLALHRSLWKARERKNAMMAVCLRDHNGIAFIVATYHMPCQFRDPVLMNAHLTGLKEAVTKFDSDLSSTGMPVILAGDFNIQPTSAEYAQFLETPTSTGMKFKSLYCETHQGKEPTFTTYAQSKRDKEPFLGTLDYIFVNEKLLKTCAILDMKTLPSEAKDLMPTKNEPSDHLMLSAKIGFVVHE